MKVLLLTIFISLFGITHSSFAQFAPIGAQWTYERITGFIYPINSYEPSDYKVVGQKQFKGKDCRVIVGDVWPCWFARYENDSLFVYEDQGKVYFFNPNLDQFSLLYDFDMEVGDTLTIAGIGDLPENMFDMHLIAIEIDASTDECNRQRKLIKLQGYDTQDPRIFTLIEGIGFAEFLLPDDNFGHCQIYTTIRCYSDASEDCQWVNYSCDKNYDKSFGFEGTRWQHCYTNVKGDIAKNKMVTSRTIKTERLSKWGMTCNTIVIDKGGADFSWVDTMVLCSNNDMTFYWVNDTLYQLYNFNLKKGDSYKIRYPMEYDPGVTTEEFIDIRIVSVTTVEIDGREFKRQEIANNKNYELGNYITQGWGFETWILPVRMDSDSGQFNGMIQYEDLKGIYDDGVECVGVNVSELPDESMSIYPNPAYDNLYLYNDNLSAIETYEYSIWSISGRQLNSGFARDGFINIQTLGSGVYMLVLSNGKTVIRKKFVKN